MFTNPSHLLARMTTRTRTAPSGYLKVRSPFHALRTTQLIASIVVGGIMSYFMYYLRHDHWGIPWTFIVLAVVSLLTVAALTTTIILHCFFGLNPLFNLALNSTLSAIWAMGFSMLSYYMWSTLTHACNVDYWHDGTGVMVCRIYKAVFVFSLLGLISTIGALALDLHIHRLARRGGRHYRLDDVDRKRGRAIAARGPYTDVDHLPIVSDEDLPRHSEAFEVPQQGYGVQTTSRQAQAEGYALPENQFDYDTGYHGLQHEDGLIGRR